MSDFSLCWLLFFSVMAVSDCIRELKVMCFCWLMLVMASITAVVGASSRTSNSMMPRCTVVGYERKFCDLIVSVKT